MVTLSYVLYDEGNILISELDQKKLLTTNAILTKIIKIIKFKP